MGFISSPPRPDRLWGPPSLLSNRYRGSYPGDKADRVWNHSPLPSAEVNAWIHTSIHPTRLHGVVLNDARDVFMMSYLVKHTDNFAFLHFMEAEHTRLLYHCEAKCQSDSRGIWIERGNIIFLNNSNKCDDDDDAYLYYNEDFIQKLAYMTNIFEKLNNMNKWKQGPQINTLTQDDEGNALMKTL